MGSGLDCGLWNYIKTVFHVKRISSHEPANRKFAFEYVFAFVFNKHVMMTRYTKNANGYDVAVTGFG